MNPDTPFISAEGAVKLVEALLARHAPAGDRVAICAGSTALDIEVERGSAVGCYFAVRFDGGRRVPVTERRSKDVVGHFWRQTPQVRITWSSTERSVAQALAALALYREMVELAALIDARLEREVIGWLEPAETEPSATS
jgi:hypothetical protein